MKKYQNYKSSGLEWLETIPEHWSISRLKYLGHLYGGLTGKSGIDFNNDENPKNKPYIPYTNIFNNTYISKDHYHYVSIDDGETQNRVNKYDLFFLMSSETHKDLGKSCILIDDVDELYLNSFCKGFRIKDKNIFPLYLNYQILGHLHREMISYEGKGFTRINLRQDKLNDLFIFYPSLEEQKQIVQFLDEKTNIIDKLISTKEHKIETLKHQRTSLINEVITRGLNPKVKLKDSGFEWIGEIPEHWNVLRLKNISTLKISSVDKHIFENENQVKVCNYTDVYYNEFISSILDFRNGSCSNEELKNFNLEKDDVIITKDSESPTDIGVPSLVVEKIENLVCGYHLSIIKTNKSKMIGGFLFRQLQTKRVRNYFEVCSNGITRYGLGKSSVLETPLIIPPILEQNQIVEHLNVRTKEIHELVIMEQKKIDLLKEYRQSIISEVITGKIDVRTNLN